MPVAVEKTYQIEREKWDALATRGAVPAELRVAAASFEHYAAKTATFAGVTDFLGPLAGKEVLEYGCGLGLLSTLLARSGARVSTFDLSPASIETARLRAEVNGVADRIEFSVAPGEKLPYEDESFDIVFGKAILHHLDVEQGWGELHRVLRPGGKAAFVEPMGMNPMLNFVRDRVPYPHKNPRGADEPLTYSDIHAWGRGYSSFEYREIQLLSMLERLLGFNRRLPALRRADAFLLSRVPALRRYCRYVVLELVK